MIKMAIRIKSLEDELAAVKAELAEALEEADRLRVGSEHVIEEVYLTRYIEQIHFGELIEAAKQGKDVKIPAFTLEDLPKRMNRARTAHKMLVGRLTDIDRLEATRQKIAKGQDYVARARRALRK